MKILKIKLVNFQSYKNEEFQMNDVMVILRENGAGKSAFLKALNFALCGDGCDDGEIMQGEKEMSVSILFENGLTVERKRKRGDRTIVHRMGYEKTKKSTKDAVNAEIAKMCNTGMSSIKVIASSRELFEMKPDVLADFIMKHIPNRMTVEDIISYIPDITDRMESEIRTLFPAGTEFGHAQIQNAFNIFDGRRKDLAREVKLNRAKISGYDFSIPVRASGEIREELASVLKEMGAYEEKIRAVRDFQARKTNRENTLARLKSLQEQYNAIHAVKPDSARKEYLDKRESELMQQADSCKKSIWELRSACNNLNRTVAALKEGLCPQVKGIKCTHDWTPVITQFESNVSQMTGNIASFQASCDAAEKELLSVREEKAAYEANFRAYSDKCSKYQAFRALKESLMPLPEEPRMPEGNLEEKKAALDGELNGAITRENLLAVKNALPEQEEQLNVLEALTSAFSKKGSVMENNTKVYLGFFEQQMNESAIKLGYVISMEMENGLHVRIGRNGRTPVDVDACSAGEKAVAIFLLLDLLNSFTGIRLLFFDEVEMLDNKVWEALLKLVEEKKGSYDHIVITGVNHDDTMEAVDRILK